MKRALSGLICLAILLSTMLFVMPVSQVEAASVISGKTGEGAAKFAISAYNQGWKYVYGASGQVITESLVKGFRKTFSGMYTDSYYKKTLKAVGSRGVDCVGLLKAYLWWQGSDKNPKPTGNVAGGASAMYNEAKEKGPMSTMPDEPGIILYRSGHIGIYVGGGYVVDARGVDYGIRKENTLSKWTKWFRSPYLSYSGKSGSSSSASSSKSGSNSSASSSKSSSDSSASSSKSSSDSSASSSKSSDSLRSGTNGSEVKKLQTRLKELGYFNGSLDGVFGKETEIAVKSFQAKASLSSDGIAGQATLKKLYANDAPKAAVTKTVSASSSTPSSSSLKLGSKGDNVTKLQKRLIALGYYKGSATGTYNDLTKKAVISFQKAVGIKATGEADSKTQTKLYSSNAPKYSVNTTANVKTSKLSTSKPSRTLKRGDSGSDVMSLQKRLKELGYLTGEVDDEFGSGTEAAVKEFQKTAGLTDDGVAGTGTINKLFASDAPKKSQYTTLRLGDMGQSVTDLQNRLISLGYLSTSVDGAYGQSTVDAIKAFQKKIGLKSDGVAGSVTQEKLFSDNAPVADGYVVSSEPASSEPISSEPEPISSEIIASELPEISSNSSEEAVIQEIVPSSDTPTTTSNSSFRDMVKTILIICVVSALLVIGVILFLERRRKVMTSNSKVIHRD